MNRLCRTTSWFALFPPDPPPSFLLVWGWGRSPKIQPFVSVSKVICTSFKFGWTLPLIYIQLFTLKPYSLLWKHSARVSGHCVANVGGVQHRENGPTPSTGPNKEEGHPVFYSPSLRRGRRTLGSWFILYWGFLRPIRSVLRLRLDIA